MRRSVVATCPEVGAGPRLVRDDLKEPNASETRYGEMATGPSLTNVKDNRLKIARGAITPLARGFVRLRAVNRL
jgi:hypothetical protein